MTKEEYELFCKYIDEAVTVTWNNFVSPVHCIPLSKVQEVKDKVKTLVSEDKND